MSKILALLKADGGRGGEGRQRGGCSVVLFVRLMLLYGQQRALDLFPEHYMDLQGCQLLLKAQTVFLKGLRGVLNKVRKRHGDGGWGMVQEIDGISNKNV